MPNRCLKCAPIGTGLMAPSTMAAGASMPMRARARTQPLFTSQLVCHPDDSSTQVESQQTMDALMFLAQYFKDPDLNRLDDAELYCQRLQVGEAPLNVCESLHASRPACLDTSLTCSLERTDTLRLWRAREQESYAADKDEVSALMKEIRQVKQSVQAQHFSGLFSSSAMSFGGVS